MAKKKRKMTYATEEEMSKINPGEVLEVDLTAGTQALDEKYAERIEFLKHSLWDVLGRISQWYPRVDDWPEERTEKLISDIAWAWHYRQEIRLLTQLGRGEFDVDEHVADWPFATDQKFGPLPDKEALLH